MVPAAQTAGDDAVPPHVEEVPLGARLALHLHGPHEPANTTGAALVGVDLGKEEVLQEVNMCGIIVREVSIVISVIKS